MNNPNLTEIVKNARYDDGTEHINIKELKKYFDFEEEIKSFDKKLIDFENVFLISAMIFVAISICFWIVKIIIMSNSSNPLFSDLGTFAIASALLGSISIFILLAVAYEIYWFIVHLFYSDEELEILKRRSKKNYKGSQLLDFFYNYFPIKYYNEFKETFTNHYKTEEEKFKKWISSDEITARQLYVKLLSNKDVQNDIYKKIWEKENQKELAKDIEEKSKKIEEKKKQVIKEEINNYFK